MNSVRALENFKPEEYIFGFARKEAFSGCCMESGLQGGQEWKQGNQWGGHHRGQGGEDVSGGAQGQVVRMKRSRWIEEIV